MGSVWPELVIAEQERESIAQTMCDLSCPDLQNCWVWTGSKFAAGYGSIKRRGGRMLAHRVIYATFKGPIPANMTLDHLCRNRACVNPGHMEVVSVGVNAMRGTGAAATNARKTHCIRGHELTEGNLVARPAGKRTCLLCHRDSTRSAQRRYLADPENRKKHAEQERVRRQFKKGSSHEYL